MYMTACKAGHRLSESLSLLLLPDPELELVEPLPELEEDPELAPLLLLLPPEEEGVGDLDSRQHQSVHAQHLLRRCHARPGRLMQLQPGRLHAGSGSGDLRLNVWASCHVMAETGSCQLISPSAH